MNDPTVDYIWCSGKSHLVKMSDNSALVSWDYGSKWQKPGTEDWWAIIAERDRRIDELQAELWQCRYWLRAVRFVRRLLRGRA